MSQKRSEKLANIVTSQHIAEGEAGALSELEFGLILAANAFQRWIVKCMEAAGGRDMNPLDVLVLHNIRHRNRPKRISDIAFTLNIEDTHTIGYSIRKLLKAELLSSQKRGKEMYYSLSSKGEALCENYREMREICLVDMASFSEEFLEDMHLSARLLRVLSGQYDQASRAASSL